MMAKKKRYADVKAHDTDRRSSAWWMADERRLSYSECIMLRELDLTLDRVETEEGEARPVMSGEFGRLCEVFPDEVEKNLREFDVPGTGCHTAHLPGDIARAMQELARKGYVRNDGRRRDHKGDSVASWDLTESGREKVATIERWIYRHDAIWKDERSTPPHDWECCVVADRHDARTCFGGSTAVKRTAHDAHPRGDEDHQELEGGGWPTYLTALDELIELEFWRWQREDGNYAWYRDQHGEEVPVHKMTDGRLVADLRED